MQSKFSQIYTSGNFVDIDKSKPQIEYVKTDINNDGYKISITHSGKIIIEYSNERSKDYANSHLNELFIDFYENGKMPVCIVEFNISLPLRGVIEGFYGKPYTHEQRLELIDFCKKFKLNSYFYAPKDDDYLRADWSKLYDESKAKKLKQLISTSKNSNIDFYYTISPGLDFKFSEESSYDKLKLKIDQILSFNCNKFCLLMDDIDKELKGNDKEKFISSGRAQSYLANFVNNYLKTKGITGLIFCPTDYMFVKGDDYRENLKKYLSDDIFVFFTGYNTIAEKISTAELREIANTYGKQLILWDNFPVNDYEPKSRIYIAPIKNRSRLASHYIKGYVINPSSSMETSKLSIACMADYAVDNYSYNPKDSFLHNAKVLYGDNAELFCDFAMLNSSSPICKSSYDINMKNAYDEQDFECLSKVYDKNLQIANGMYEIADSKLLLEIEPYLNYIKKEVQVFNQLKNATLNCQDIKELNMSKNRTSNQYLLEYIKKNKLTDIEINIDEERANFWKLQEENLL